MTRVIVKDEENLEKALKKFKRLSSFKRREIKKRKHYMSKKEKRIFKQNKGKKFR